MILPDMKTRLRRSLSVLLGIAALALGAAAEAARIDGLSPFEPAAADNVVPSVTGDAMYLALPDGRRLTVTPWPAFLPQRFGRQSISGERRMHPAGPIDRLTFSRDAEASPWMAIGNGARQSTRLVADWQLQLARGRWLLTDGKARKIFEKKGMPPKPLMVNVGAERWCIYLLESTIPVPQSNIAMEAEPRIEWAAIRLSRLQNRCSLQK